MARGTPTARPTAPAPTRAPAPVATPAAPAETDDQRADRIARKITGGARTAAAPAPSGGLVNDGAGVILGAVLWALVLNTLRYGPAGARGWLAAKFLNKPLGQGLAGKVGRKISDTAASAEAAS